MKKSSVNYIIILMCVAVLLSTSSASVPDAGYCGGGVKPPQSASPIAAFNELEIQVQSEIAHGCIGEKCLPCPPPCPVPELPKIEQPGEGGGGGGGGGAGGGGGGGGGSPESPMECGPGSESASQSSMLSDDYQERYSAMNDLFESSSKKEVIPSYNSGYDSDVYSQSLPMRMPSLNPFSNPQMRDQVNVISGAAVLVPVQEESTSSPVVTDGFIEIYNPLKKSIRLANYELRDNTGNVKLAFPSDAVIEPGEYKVVAFSSLFADNFNVDPDFIFDGFSVEKFKGTIAMVYNGPEGFKYVDYVRYGEKSKPMYLAGDTPPAKQSFLPVDLEEKMKVAISEFTIDYSNKIAYVEIVNVGSVDYNLAGHKAVVYAGEDYYEGGLDIVIPPGAPVVLTFSSSGPVNKNDFKGWICPAGYDPEQEICLSAPIKSGTELLDFSEMKDAARINHAGLIPRAEVALIKEPSACKESLCAPEIIDSFSKELTDIPFSGTVSFQVASQKLLMGSVVDRSGDFVEGSPSLGVIDAASDPVVRDIISPKGKHAGSNEFSRESEKSPGYSSQDSVVNTPSDFSAITGLSVSSTIQNEISYTSGTRISPAVESPAAASTVISYTPSVTASSPQLSDDALEEAKKEYFETPCETAIRKYNECKEGKPYKEKGMTIPEKIAAFDVDAELENVLNDIRNNGVDVDSPDIYKEQLGNIHSRLVEKLFETVWDSDFKITNYKADYRRLIKSYFAYDVTPSDPSAPIVSFDHYFDWRQKLITMNDFQLSSDFQRLNLEEKLFDINRAIYYRLGYDYRTYSAVDDPMSAHWNVVKFGAVPTEAYSSIRQRVDGSTLNTIIKGIGDDFSLLKHMNGFVRPNNNLDKISPGMAEVGYSTDEINRLIAIIQNYPVEKAPEPKTLGTAPGPDYCDNDIADACMDADYAMSDLVRDGFGDPIVSFQRIDMNEGEEYVAPFGESSSGMQLGSSDITGGITGLAVGENVRSSSFSKKVQTNRINELTSQKPQLYENLRKGIDVDKSNEKINAINREISAISPEYAQKMSEQADMTPQGIDGLELRNPQPARSDTDSLTNIFAESTDDNDPCASGKTLPRCERDMHILITEIFPGTVRIGPEESKVLPEETGSVRALSSQKSAAPIAAITGGFSMITGMAVSDIGESTINFPTLEHGTGENGIVEHDETSEDVDNTWEMLLACPGQGPGACAPIPPEYIPEPEPYPPYDPYPYPPEEDPISCGYVTSRTSSDRINPQYVEGEFRIPFGYEIIKGPFSLDCNDDSYDLSFTVPDQYTGVKVLRCNGQMCSETITTETPVEELYCDGYPISQQIENEFTTTQPAVDPLMLDVIFDVQRPLDENNVITEQGYSVQFDSGGFDVEIATPDDYVYPAENSNYYIMGAPFVVFANVSDGIGASIEMPLVPRENYDGFGIFALVGGVWEYVQSKVDVNTGKVIARVDDFGSLMSNGEVMFSVMGMYCHSCRGTELNKVYDGGSREAVILVHGLTSTPSTWQFMISDFSLTKQPYQVWVFGYPASVSLDDAAVALANQLENVSAGMDRIHLVGHSLGGMVIQQTVNFADWNKYDFVKKVKKTILVATPNKGSPAAELYDKLRNFLVNSKKVAGVYFINPLVVDDVLKGRDIPRVEGIDYYVVAGTRSYPFSLGYFDSVNDGVVSVDSAKYVGGESCGNMCDNYFEINLSHTDLISHPAARKVIEYIISMERAKEDPSAELAGYDQYGHLLIDECGPDDKFVIVGKHIPEIETPGILSCKCGNGQCDAGETPASCPKDCAGNFGAWLCPLLPKVVPLLLLAILLLSSAYLITKRLQKKEVSNVWRDIDYGLIGVVVLLMLLGVLICKYFSLVAVLIIIVIVVLLLLDFFIPLKKKEIVKSAVKKKVKRK